MQIMKIGLLGIVGVILALQLKNSRAEYGVYISIAFSLLVFFSVIYVLQEILQTMERLSGYFTFQTTYFHMLMKLLGVAYVAEFSSNVCKDAGYQSIAVQIELFSKIVILMIGMPIVLSLVKATGELLS